MTPEEQRVLNQYQAMASRAGNQLDKIVAILDGLGIEPTSAEGDELSAADRVRIFADRAQARRIGEAQIAGIRLGAATVSRRLREALPLFEGGGADLTWQRVMQMGRLAEAEAEADSHAIGATASRLIWRAAWALMSARTPLTEAGKQAAQALLVDPPTSTEHAADLIRAAIERGAEARVALSTLAEAQPVTDGEQVATMAQVHAHRGAEADAQAQGLPLLAACHRLVADVLASRVHVATQTQGHYALLNREAAQTLDALGAPVLPPPYADRLDMRIRALVARLAGSAPGGSTPAPAQPTAQPEPASGARRGDW